jgi:hypothetical protein
MYLLLRDNKQSGPYTLDELKTKGLKAYDLVWVEGRSAAWRYPSEIDALSAFAPAVEEQPFDRFFKKPAAATATTTSAVTAAKPVDKAVVAATGGTGATKRSIYVTMPGGIAPRDTSPVRETSPVRDTTPTREVVREIAPAKELEIAPVREPAFPVQEARPLRERVSYRQEPETEILPPLQRRKPTRVWLPVGIGAAVLILLTAGIFIGLSIQKDAPGFQKLASQTSRDKGQPPLVRTTAQPLPVAPANSPAATTDQTAQLITAPTNAIAAGTDRPAGKLRGTSPRQKTEAPNVQKKDGAQTAVPTVVTDTPAVQPVVLHREAVHRTDALQNQPVDDRESLRVALANQVAVGANKYEVGTFGGIHDLQVTVTNRSAYSLDLVVVAVSYIQANKKTYKTENLYFRGIGPGSALMLEAPKSSRGINVEYKVTSINSKELGLSEPGM